LVSSIAGSGGLLTLPALLWAGLPPLSALATNKLQSAMGTLSSVTNFRRHGYLHIAPLVPSLMMAFCGSMLGTLCVQRLSNELLMRAIPLLLVLLGGYFLCAPKMDDCDYPARLSNAQFAATAAFGIGFFGPASGSILPVLLVFLLGHSLVRATAESKLFILVINGVSALLFVISGGVVWGLAIAMGIAQIVDARIGSNLVIHRGVGLVQPLIAVVTLLVALKLLFYPAA
jgi:uncharacterized membrane protein YfcA